MATEQLPTRALQKQARRDALVAAAEVLVREHSDTNFSMLDLAKLAGLSPATPYNLFGGKSGILYALLSRSADKMFAAWTAADGTMAGRVIGAAEALAQVLAEDPAFYRPLYSYLMGVVDASWRPAFMTRTHAYWASTIIISPQTGSPIPSEILTDLLVTQALGCVELWVHGEIENAHLRTELCRSACAVLLGIVEGPDRERLINLITAPRSLRIASVQAPVPPEKKRLASE